MGEVVNLRLVRKRAARAAREDAAARNRTEHGLSKTERETARRESERASRGLDGARLGGPRPGGDDDAGA